ncbi:MAG TPA: response regulator [Geobacteraceae bacterium]|nr:response regulator [Geobacteraceae bacterium]
MLKKVLVVDDSSLIHQMYRLVLNRYNCTIADAMNGQEALELLALQNDIELILLDINMPVMNGLQFLEKASPLGIVSRIPVIIISTEGKEEDTIRGLKLGARGYLKKPFHPASLHEMIEKIFCQPNSIHERVTATL